MCQISPSMKGCSLKAGHPSACKGRVRTRKQCLTQCQTPPDSGKSHFRKAWNGPKTSLPPGPSEEKRKLYSFSGITPVTADISRNSILNLKSKPWDRKPVWGKSVMIAHKILQVPREEWRPARLHRSIPVPSHLPSHMFRPSEPRKSITHATSPASVPDFASLIICLIDPER